MQRCMGCMEEFGSEYDVCPYCGYIVGTKPESKVHLKPGTVLQERYMLGRVLGQGGFGVTYIAWDNKLNRAVAVKEYMPRSLASRIAKKKGVEGFNVQAQKQFDRGLKKMLRETKTLAQLNDLEGVVRVYDCIQENQTAYIIMELLRGRTVRQLLKERRKLAFAEMMQIMTPILRTLDAMHKIGMIHRDVAPDNIFVCEDGRVKLLDFGAARVVNDDADEKTLSVMLKKGYAPLEQYSSKAKQGPYTDVYAACATMYKILTGRTPKDCNNRMNGEELRPISDYADVPKGAVKAIEKGMAIRPKERTQTIGELMQELEQSMTKKQKKAVLLNLPLFPSAQANQQGGAKRLSPKVIAIAAGAVALVCILLVVGGARKKGEHDTGAAAEVQAVEDEALVDVASAGWLDAGDRHTVARRADGTLVATGSNEYGQCDVSSWKNIRSVAAGAYHTVGLRSDGTVAATVCSYDFGQCDVQKWTDIVAIDAGSYHTVGLRSDGTVVATGWDEYGQCDVQGWTDMIAVAAAGNHTVGLRRDGTVAAAGWNDNGQCGVQSWTNITAIAAGGFHTVGLRADGTVVAAGWNRHGQCDVQNWTNITALAAGRSHTVGLRSDGTVVAAGNGDEGQCKVQDWNKIAAISAGSYHTVGLRSDDMVVATGLNDDGQCGVTRWKQIIE